MVSRQQSQSNFSDDLVSVIEQCTSAEDLITLVEANYPDRADRASAQDTILNIMADYAGSISHLVADFLDYVRENEA